MTIYEIALGGEGRLLHRVRPTRDSLSHIRCASLNRRREDYRFQYVDTKCEISGEMRHNSQRLMDIYCL